MPFPPLASFMTRREQATDRATDRAKLGHYRSRAAYDPARVMKPDGSFATSVPASVEIPKFHRLRGTATFGSVEVRWTPTETQSVEGVDRVVRVASIRQVAVEPSAYNRLDITLWGDFGELTLVAGSRVFLWREITALRAVRRWLKEVGFTRFRRPKKSRFGYGRLWMYARTESDVDWEV